jgi:hypothetical protein
MARTSSIADRGTVRIIGSTRMPVLMSFARAPTIQPADR